jgi:CRISPR-associated protein Cas2
MSDTTPRLHIVCYDIADPKRLARVHRCLIKAAIPLQYSVFLAHMDKRDLLDLLAEVEQIIDCREDDLRAYPLPSRLEYVQLGRQPLPEGVSLLGGELPSELLNSAA